jgi:hypothetical protein
MRDLHEEIGTTRRALYGEIRRVDARVDTVLCNVVLAILVSIFLRVLFH